MKERFGLLDLKFYIENCLRNNVPFDFLFLKEQFEFTRNVKNLFICYDRKIGYYYDWIKGNKELYKMIKKIKEKYVCICKNKTKSRI
jgi:hypothetical protein